MDHNYICVDNVDNNYILELGINCYERRNGNRVQNLRLNLYNSYKCINLFHWINNGLVKDV